MIDGPRGLGWCELVIGKAYFASHGSDTNCSPLLKRSIRWHVNSPLQCPPPPPPHTSAVIWRKASFTFYRWVDDKAGEVARTALWGIQTWRSGPGSSSTRRTYFQEMGLLRISLCGYNPFQNFCALFIFSVESGSVGWIILNYAWLCFQISESEKLRKKLR